MRFTSPSTLGFEKMGIITPRKAPGTRHLNRLQNRSFSNQLAAVGNCGLTIFVFEMSKNYSF